MSTCRDWYGSLEECWVNENVLFQEEERGLYEEWWIGGTVGWCDDRIMEGLRGRSDDEPKGNRG